MFVPRAQANVDEGICLSDTDGICADDSGSGFSSSLYPKGKTTVYSYNFGL